MSVLSTLARFRPKLKEAAQLETTQLQLINLDAAAQAYEASEEDDAVDLDEGLPPIPPPRPREPVRLPQFELRFEPVWASATGFAALSLVRPVGRMRGDGPLVRGHALSPSEGGGAMRMEFDRNVLMAAGRAWQEAAGESTPGALAVPVHFETLVTVKYRLPYMAAINALDEKARSALILHVLGADMDAPMGRLTEVCRLARTLTRRIMVHIDPRTVRLDRFNDSRVDVFSITAPATAEMFVRQCAGVAALAEKLPPGASYWRSRSAMTRSRFPAGCPLHRTI